MIWKNKGKQKTSHLTVNGRLEFSRTVFWNENHGTVVPVDILLGIGSGPTESFCGCLAKRLKGSGMRWDKDNAESVTALGSIYYSNQWDEYWKSRHKAA